VKKDYSMGLLGAMFWSIPFYFIWNKLAPIYCYWLPPVYQHLPFWHCMGLFVLLAILRALIYPPRAFYQWKFNYKGWHHD
jgi:hypothetical protein